ncbi:MAG: nucleotidyl transferase AbiEii/AbiGii toxin family protein, partial [Armatimonadota bacterium]
LWSDEPHRMTQDIDLLGSGDSAIPELVRVFQDICSLPTDDDGLRLPTNEITAEEIREDQVYGGIRIKITAYLGKTRIPLQVDIGFGDAVIPGPEEVSIPSLLDLPDPRLRAYPRETVVAENSQAMERLFICSKAGEMKQAASLCPKCSQNAMEAEAVWDETENEIRYRVRDPEDFEPDSFRRRALDGVVIIIGKLKKEQVPRGHDPEAMVVQAYRFAKKTDSDPEGWTTEKAKDWIEQHEPQASSAEIRTEENMRALSDAPLADDLDLLSCQAGMDPVKVTGYMDNKFVMLGWIERHIPKDAKTVLDAFSGGANVAYHLKRKGIKVIANDLLLFPYHVARAVVENSHETLSDEDIERILAPNPNTRARSSSTTSVATTTPSGFSRGSTRCGLTSRSSPTIRRILRSRPSETRPRRRAFMVSSIARRSTSRPKQAGLRRASSPAFPSPAWWRASNATPTSSTGWSSTAARSVRHSTATR